MTIWADSSDGYMNERRFKPRTVREFVRRVRRGVANRDKTFVWMLGAGCSASSGVDSAEAAVRRWVKDLHYLETGADGAVDAWAARRFVGYDPAAPAKAYGSAFAELFTTEHEQRIELARMVKGAEPGFGYATLAQLMTHPSHGPQLNLAVTTNFDDLLADALYLFSQKRPTTLTNESVTEMTALTGDSPTVVKIYGDAHLSKKAKAGNRPQLEPVVRERLGERIAESCLIFVGYGGRDESVLDLVQSLPVGSPIGGVYWVNATPPTDALGEELERRGAIWVEHADFDELMFYFRVEFGLSHPSIERFENVLVRYNAQYRELSTREGLDIAPQEREGDISLGDMPGRRPTAGLLDGVDLGEGARCTRRDTEQRRYNRLLDSLGAVKRAAEADREDLTIESDGRQLDDDDWPADSPRPGSSAVSIGDGAPHNHRQHALPGHALDDVRRALAGRGPDALLSGERDRSGARPPRAVAELGSELNLTPPREREQAPSSPRDAYDGPDARVEQPVDSGRREDEGPVRDHVLNGRTDLGRGARRFTRRPSEVDDAAGAPRAPEKPRSAAPAARAVDLPPLPFHRLSAEDAARGEAAYTKLIEAGRGGALVHSRYGQYLAIAAGDLERAEAAFERAHQLEPGNAVVLREYSRFAMERLRDYRRAEKLLTEALEADLREPETLLHLAHFLLRARGDLQEADNCMRLAIEVGRGHIGAATAYAEFLERRRGRRDAAEAQLRRAVEVNPSAAEAHAALALFRARHGAVEAAEQTLAEAERLEPNNATALLARAALAERRGDVDAAERALKRAVEVAPGDVRARLAYAKRLATRPEALEAAERQHRNAVAIAPYLGEPMAEYGRFLRVVMKDAARADAFLQRATETEPYDPFVLAAFAEHVASKGGMVEEADTFFRDAIDLAPGAAEIRRAYGRFLNRIRKQPEAAEAQLRKAVEIDPSSADALEELADFLYRTRRDAEDAEAYFLAALKVAPNRSDTLQRFATFLRETRGDVEEAEIHFRRALENSPKDAQNLARAAQFLLARGRRAEGLKVLNECFDLAWRMEPSERPAALMLELWIYRYAHDPGRRDESLESARALIEKGARCDGWEMEATLEEAERARHPDLAMLRDLIAVAAEGADPELLRRRR